MGFTQSLFIVLSAVTVGSYVNSIRLGLAVSFALSAICMAVERATIKGDVLR
jgi:hypothetical protein